MKKKKISLLVNLIFIFFSIIIFSYIYYRDNYFYSGSKNYEIYYTIILFFFIFFVLTLFIKEEIRTNIYIIIISSIISLYLLEILTFFFILKKPNQEFLLNFDKRSRFEVYTEMIEKNIEIYPPIFPRYFLLDDQDYKYDFETYLPFGNLSNKKILWCNENGYYITFNTDKYGFRNDNNLWLEKNLDFILIGDSYVEGACVHTEDILSKKLAEFTNKTILNLRRGGNGPLLNLAILKEYGQISQGTNVIWFYYEGNDVEEMNKELKNKILVNYLNNENFSQNLKEKTSIINNDLLKYTMTKIQDYKKTINKYERNFNQIKFSKIFKLHYLRYYFTMIFVDYLSSDYPELKSDELENILLILENAKQYVEKKGGDFYFVYLPSYNRYIRFKENENYFSKKILLEKLEFNKFKVIDIDERVFKTVDDPLNLYPLRRSGHFNPKGYKIIAEEISKDF